MIICHTNEWIYLVSRALHKIVLLAFITNKASSHNGH